MSGYDRVPRIGGTPEDAARDVDRELEFHLEMRVRELEAAGHSPAEARREAERRFGDLRGARRRLREDASRAARRTAVRRWLEETWGDLVHAVRGLRGSPGYAAVAILTLALGIGATTAIFSALNAVLLRPLPYAEPERLVSVWEVTPSGEDHNMVSPGNYLDWREGSTSFELLAAYTYSFPVGLTGGDRPEQVQAMRATPELYVALGVQAAAGRTFTAEEGIAGGEGVVLLAHGLWQRRFGGDRAVVGETITLAEQPVRVVGVLPAGFDFAGSPVDVVLPLRFDAEDREERRSHNLLVLGRLARGASVARAESQLSAVAAATAERHPEYMRGWGVNVAAYRADLVRGVRESLILLMGSVALVLLVACVNVANLLLARGLARRREFAVRAALGAGRLRLIRQALTESVLLAGIGGAAGLVLAVALLRLLVGFAPADVPLLAEAGVDGDTLAFAAAAAIASALLFGALPAARVAAADPQRTLRDGQGATGGRTLRIRTVLLVGEVALSVMLMVGAGLLIRSLVRVQEQDPGFDTGGLVAVSLDLPYSRYEDRAQQRAFYDAALERIRRIPRVLAAVGTAEPPVIGYDNTFSFEIEGRPRPGPNPRQEPATLEPVTPGYFEAMRIPIVAGRAFDARDRADAPAVAIVNRTMAERLWPDGDAIGSHVRRDQDQPWIEIVGVAGDTRHHGLEEAVRPAWYIPYAQAPWSWMSWMTLMVRVGGPDPLSLAGALEQAIWSVDADLPINRIGLVEDFYVQDLARRRFITLLLGAFAVLALVLGAVGLYGVLAYSVAGRRREFGLRLALGETSRSVAARVVRHGMTLTAIGLLLGTAAALAVSRVLRSLLWGVEPGDPVTLAAVAGVLLCAAALACWVPVRRATRADPLVALRGS